MDTEHKILDLLFWMKGKGFYPVKLHRRDRFLNPITKKIGVVSQLKEHQIKYSLWLPTVDGVKHLLPDINLEDHGGLKMVSAAGRTGAGMGESEALLSLFHNMRTAA